MKIPMKLAMKLDIKLAMKLAKITLCTKEPLNTLRCARFYSNDEFRHRFSSHFGTILILFKSIARYALSYESLHSAAC